MLGDEDESLQWAIVIQKRFKKKNLDHISDVREILHKSSLTLFATMARPTQILFCLHLITVISLVYCTAGDRARFN